MLKVAGGRVGEEERDENCEARVRVPLPEKRERLGSSLERCILIGFWSLIETRNVRNKMKLQST